MTTPAPLPGLAVWSALAPGRPPADCDWHDWRFAKAEHPRPEVDPGHECLPTLWVRAGG